jgi:hypothetical protein
VSRQFEGHMCALCCTRPSSPTGEHVWPAWFLDSFPESEGPYTRHVNGHPETKRDDVTVRTQTSLERVKLPCCIECNGILEERFERSAKPVVRRFMAIDGHLTLDAGEAETLGLWLLKTWLLLAHPAARSSTPGRSPQRWDLSLVPTDICGWTVNGGPVPSGFSVWVAREVQESTGSKPERRIPLPRVVADGQTVAFQVFRCAVRFLDVTLAYHPGWSIAHPLEREGRAARLWPTIGRAINFDALPPVASRDTVCVEGPTLTFAPGMFGSTSLRPLGPDWDPMFPPLPGVVFAAAPRLHPGSE